LELNLVKALKKKESSRITMKLKVPHKKSKKKYYIKAFCDSGGTIVEEDENNNVEVSRKVKIRE